VRFFCPSYMDKPDQIDKESFLALMLKRRPEYAIVWDVRGKDVIEFQARVWVVQYVVIRGDNVYFSQSRHYAKRAKVLFNLTNIVQVDTNEEWEKNLPEVPEFKRIRYWSPDVVEAPTEIDMEDFINKMLKIRPPFAVLWDVSLDDIKYMASRVYVVSYMPVIGDTIYFSYAKHYAALAQKKFNIVKREKIDIQDPLKQDIQ
jgi:hypothetical protein